jgi:hypothetical protein
MVSSILFEARSSEGERIDITGVDEYKWADNRAPSASGTSKLGSDAENREVESCALRFLRESELGMWEAFL